MPMFGLAEFVCNMLFGGKVINRCRYTEQTEIFVQANTFEFSKTLSFTRQRKFTSKTIKVHLKSLTTPKQSMPTKAVKNRRDETLDVLNIVLLKGTTFKCLFLNSHHMPI